MGWVLVEMTLQSGSGGRGHWQGAYLQQDRLTGGRFGYLADTGFPPNGGDWPDQHKLRQHSHCEFIGIDQVGAASVGIT